MCSRRQFPFLLDAFTYMCSCVRHTCIFLVKCIPILNKYLYSCVSDLFHSIHQSGCMDLHESNIKAISQHFHLGFGVTMKISRNSLEIGGMKILCKVMGSCYAEILYQCTEGPIKHGMTVKVEAIWFHRLFFIEFKVFKCPSYPAWSIFEYFFADTLPPLHMHARGINNSQANKHKDAMQHQTVGKYLHTCTSSWNSIIKYTVAWVPAGSLYFTITSIVPWCVGGWKMPPKCTSVIYPMVYQYTLGCG